MKGRGVILRRGGISRRCGGYTEKDGGDIYRR